MGTLCYSSHPLYICFFVQILSSLILLLSIFTIDSCLSSQFFKFQLLQYSKVKSFCNRKSQTKILKLKLKPKPIRDFLQPKPKTETGTESLQPKPKPIKKFFATETENR